jgi:hypothetical protein
MAIQHRGGRECAAPTAPSFQKRGRSVARDCRRALQRVLFIPWASCLVPRASCLSVCAGPEPVGPQAAAPARKYLSTEASSPSALMHTSQLARHAIPQPPVSMNTPAARIWTEQLLFGAGRLRPRSAPAVPSAPFLRAFSSTTRTAIALSRPPASYVQQNALFLLRRERTALGRRLHSLRFKSDKNPSRTPNPTPHLGSPEPALSLTQRFRKLSREYGWLALWVYLGLTALDFPFCFLAVRTLGVERIGHYEHVIVDSIKSVLRIPFPSLWKEAEALGVALPDELAEATEREGAVGHAGEVDHAVAKDGAAGACMRPATSMLCV